MNGNGQQPQAVPISKQITCQGWSVTVANAPDGGRILQLVDPIAGAVYLLPLTPEGARNVGKLLISSVPVAGVDEMPGPK
jgi:hypothetical protein